MLKTQNLQDAFLNQARRDRLTVNMFLMNGSLLPALPGISSIRRRVCPSMRFD